MRHQSSILARKAVCTESSVVVTCLPLSRRKHCTDYAPDCKSPDTLQCQTRDLGIMASAASYAWARKRGHATRMIRSARNRDVICGRLLGVGNTLNLRYPVRAWHSKIQNRHALGCQPASAHSSPLTAELQIMK